MLVLNTRAHHTHIIISVHSITGLLKMYLHLLSFESGQFAWWRSNRTDSYKPWNSWQNVFIIHTEKSFPFKVRHHGLCIKYALYLLFP